MGAEDDPRDLFAGGEEDKKLTSWFSLIEMFLLMWGNYVCSLRKAACPAS
jgi:hypothetical protein